MQNWYKRIKKNHLGVQIIWLCRPKDEHKHTPRHTKHTTLKYHIKEHLYGQVSAGAGSPSLSTRATSNSTLHEDETGASALQTKVVPPLTSTRRKDRSSLFRSHICSDIDLVSRFLWNFQNMSSYTFTTYLNGLNGECSILTWFYLVLPRVSKITAAYSNQSSPLTILTPIFTHRNDNTRSHEIFSTWKHNLKIRHYMAL